MPTWKADARHQVRFRCSAAQASTSSSPAGHSLALVAAVSWAAAGKLKFSSDGLYPLHHNFGYTSLKLADLVVFAKNPLEDIHNTTSVLYG